MVIVCLHGGCSGQWASQLDRLGAPAVSAVVSPCLFERRGPGRPAAMREPRVPRAGAAHHSCADSERR